MRKRSIKNTRVNAEVQRELSTIVRHISVYLEMLMSRSRQLRGCRVQKAISVVNWPEH